MPAAISSSARRRPTLSTVAVAALAGITITSWSCAGRHHLNEAPPHPIAMEINNNLTVPTELTVYVTQDQGGIRTQIGTVPGAQSKTFTYTPQSWGQSYRFVAERPLAGPLRSPSFTVSDPQTGTIVWSVVPNQVQFYEVADSASARAAPASH